MLEEALTADSEVVFTEWLLDYCYESAFWTRLWVSFLIRVLSSDYIWDLSFLFFLWWWAWCFFLLFSTRVAVWPLFSNSLLTAFLTSLTVSVWADSCSIYFSDSIIFYFCTSISLSADFSCSTFFSTFFSVSFTSLFPTCFLCPCFLCFFPCGFSLTPSF